MGRILVLQHHPVETLGSIADALAGARLEFEYVRTFAGESVPRDIDSADGLVVMGGPMSVYETDRYPFIRDEIALIRKALDAGRPVLGVCLGSQLLAASLGARVTRGEAKEIGWYPVRLAAEAGEDPLMRGLPEAFTAFHWHGDVFELPRGAVALASSDLTAVQAFRYGAKAWGLLFHMEVTDESVHAMVREFTDEVTESGGDGDTILAAAPGHLSALESIASTVFSRWAAMVARG